MPKGVRKAAKVPRFEFTGEKRMPVKDELYWNGKELKLATTNMAFHFNALGLRPRKYPIFRLAEEENA